MWVILFHLSQGNRELRDFVETTGQPVPLILGRLLCSAHSLALAESTAAAQRNGERESSQYCCLLGTSATKRAVLK